MIERSKTKLQLQNLQNEVRDIVYFSIIFSDQRFNICVIFQKMGQVNSLPIGRYTTVLFIIMTVIVLYLDDIRIGFTPKPADIYIDMIFMI